MNVGGKKTFCGDVGVCVHVFGGGGGGVLQ
jgi:hypothetical protein